MLQDVSKETTSCSLGGADGVDNDNNNDNNDNDGDEDREHEHDGSCTDALSPSMQVSAPAAPGLRTAPIDDPLGQGYHM